MRPYPFLLVAGALVAGAPVLAEEMKLPPLQPQGGPQLVVDEHVDALNACDWDRLMAQYPPEVEFHLPNGTVIKGRDKIGELFAGFCQERGAGGFKGLTFTPEHVFTVGDTLTVTWRAEADFLAEPYRGADAYVTQHGLMYAQVTTFDPADMKFK
jgi:ketosteroid isomerase-like protein